MAERYRLEDVAEMADRSGGPRCSRGKHWRPVIGTAFVDTGIDDRSRIGYAEIHADERTVTAIAALHRPTASFAERGVIVEQACSGNGSCYRNCA